LEARLVDHETRLAAREADITSKLAVVASREDQAAALEARLVDHETRLAAREAEIISKSALKRVGSDSSQESSTVKRGRSDDSWHVKPIMASVPDIQIAKDCNTSPMNCVYSIRDGTRLFTYKLGMAGPHLKMDRQAISFTCSRMLSTDSASIDKMTINVTFAAAGGSEDCAWKVVKECYQKALHVVPRCAGLEDAKQDVLRHRNSMYMEMADGAKCSHALSLALGCSTGRITNAGEAR